MAKLKNTKTAGISNINNETLKNGGPKLMEDILNPFANTRYGKRYPGNEPW
jgi:hypothetical protein